MGRTYFTLAVREDGQWSPQFGDYDNGVVCEEAHEYQQCGTLKRDIKVIESADDQPSINAAIAALNAE